jgi:hypothetical protein
MRELHCVCGNRLVARNDQELTRELLTHAHEARPEMDLTEVQAREMVASQASDTEQALVQSNESCASSSATFPTAR